MGALGVFDSGVGGLTVVREIKRRWPGRKIVYLGDTARVPYGPRGREVVTRFARQGVKFLLERGVEEVVIACNTVSALAGEEIRATCPKPTHEMILPAAEAARRQSRSGRIGVIGTRGTVASRAYSRALAGYQVVERACPLLVPFIEEGLWEGEILESLVRQYVRPIVEEGVDTLILGCTHYPLIEPVIRRTVGEGMELVNCGRAVAERLEWMGEAGEDEFYFTDTESAGLGILPLVLGWQVEVRRVDLEG